MLRVRNVTLHDVAAALTRVVLQHPGGPYKRMPFVGDKPIRRCISGYSRGHSTAWGKKNIDKQKMHAPTVSLPLLSVYSASVAEVINWL